MPYVADDIIQLRVRIPSLIFAQVAIFQISGSTMDPAFCAVAMAAVQVA